MRKSILSLLFVPLILAGCGGLSKMAKNSNTVRYQPTPNPMETMDGKVMIKFAGKKISGSAYCTPLTSFPAIG